jgi:preprotein translocase subunit SecA
MLGFISKLLGGNKSDKDVKLISPLVPKINAYFQEYNNLSHDALRAKTNEFRARISDYLKEVNDEITNLDQEAIALPVSDVLGKDELYKKKDEAVKRKDKLVEEILSEILPEAYAVVKEASRRLKENEIIEVTATEHDRNLALKRQHVKIEGDRAKFANTWMAAGNPVTWNMVHYDVQLIGGIVLNQGKIAEMATGEGKTLVATLPAYLNALPGLGVHIVTVNDYLARRDSEWNGALFEFLGLTVDCIDNHQPNSEERRKAYLADITYGTNNEFGFDYLRDNMVHSTDEMVQRKHHFAMVDEVDSVLIDDARTPLIISGPITGAKSDQEYQALKPRIELLVDAQKKVVSQYLIDAKKKFEANEDDPKTFGLSVMRAYRGLPKNSALIKFLSEPGAKVKMQKSENYYLADNQREMHKVDTELFFVIDEKNNDVQLTEKGIQLITKNGEDSSFFILPDISTTLTKIEQNVEWTEEERRAQKEQLITEYQVKADRIHTIQQLLKAYTLFEKDDEYVVLDGQVKIVDEQTGRIMEGRRYSDGLHQAIEAKENVKIEAATQTYATITLQNYFRMYHKLCGMTGTAETEAKELWDIYKLDVVGIPTNIPVIRKDEQDMVYKTKREKYKAVIDEVIKLREAGRPILVGTTSVEVSELLSRMLKQNNVPHNVLNAKQHAREAQVVAEAGIGGNVTIATNMAGRGTDIKLTAESKAAGGLAIVGTERHESRRVDRQLRGRAGRQGDPGSSLFFVSLEDDLMRMFGSDRIASLMDRMGHKEGDVIQHGMISKSIERAQKKVEENNFGTRKHLLEYDDVMNKQRTVVYTKRQHALHGDRLKVDIDNSFYSIAELLVNDFTMTKEYDNFKFNVLLYFGLDTSITKEEFEKGNNLQDLTQKLYLEAWNNYSEKCKHISQQALPVFEEIKKTQGNHIENVIVPFNDGKLGLNVVAPMVKTIESQGAAIIDAMEKSITLAVIDEAWKEHLRSMDDLKQSVRTASYEQKDPLVIYKIEAFNLFKKMDEEANKNIVSFLCHGHIAIAEEDADRVKEARREKTDMSRMRANKDEIDARGDDYAANQNDYFEPGDVAVKQMPIRVEPKIGRNDPCPCGSGKKFKNCHG